MEEKINIAEILANCPKNIKLWSPLLGDALFSGINIKEKYAIKAKIPHSNHYYSFTKYGQPFSNPYCECMLFPSKEMRDWSKLAWKKGDLLKTENGEFGLFDCWHGTNYTIMKIKFQNLHDSTYIHRYTEPTSWTKETNENTIKQYISSIEKAEGGKLNLETLEIERKHSINLLKEVKKCEFEPFQKVLVRDLDTHTWKAGFFSHYQDNTNSPYYCIPTGGWRQCIPYNDQTKHLLSTTNDWKGGE